MTLMVRDQSRNRMERTIPNRYAGWRKFPRTAEAPVMRKGETNWLKYSAAETSGMTVLAAVLPAFMEPCEMTNGTPAPLAKPTRADPSNVPTQPPRYRKTKPSRKMTGETTFVMPFAAFMMRKKRKPPTAATTQKKKRKPGRIRTYALQQLNSPRIVTDFFSKSQEK